MIFRSSSKSNTVHPAEARLRARQSCNRALDEPRLLLAANFRKRRGGQLVAWLRCCFDTRGTAALTHGALCKQMPWNSELLLG